MIHDDYIMRLLNRFARGMAQILAKRALGDQPGAMDEIGDTMHELFGLQPRFFHHITERELKAVLHSGGRFNPEKAFMLAELLREYAEVAADTDGSDDGSDDGGGDGSGDSSDDGNGDGSGSGDGSDDGSDDGPVVPLLLASARLYADALTASEKMRTEEFTAPFYRLCDRLDDYELPVPLMVKLLGCHEAMGRFSRAEDILYRMLEADEPRGLRAGIAFYENLMEKTDEDLEEGDLPRDEVEEGLRALNERQKR